MSPCSSGWRRPAGAWRRSASRARCVTPARSSSRCGRPCSRGWWTGGCATESCGSGAAASDLSRTGSRVTSARAAWTQLGGTVAVDLDVQYGIEMHDIASLAADAVVVTVVEHEYDPMLAVLCVLDSESAAPAPGGLPLTDHEWFGFVADNQAKGISSVPGVNLARPSRSHGDGDQPVDAAAPFIGAANVVETRLVSWQHGRPKAVTGPGCRVVERHPRLVVVAGDQYGGMPSRGRGRGALGPRRVADEVLTRPGASRSS